MMEASQAESTATATGSSRSEQWEPPPRPEWVRRLNEEGSYMDLPRVVPLDEDSLIGAAKANTGLDDFGEKGWYEPFQVLIKALEEEAHLNLIGRLLTRTDLLMFLEGRLMIEDAYKKHPEIDEEEIVKPLVIVGQGRSGTTMLQNVMAEDPDSGTPRDWEVMFPCPPPEAATYETDERIEKADKLMTMWSRVTPEIESMHEFTGLAPTESIHVHCLGFRSPAWFDSIQGQCPSYSAYMMSECDLADAYRYEKRVLKLLQWKNPRRTWVMKSPFTLTHLPVVLEVYPDAGFIWPHRDPIRALASMISLVGTLHWIRSDHPFSGDTLAQLTDAELSGGMLAQPIKWLEEGVLSPEQLCSIQYRDLVDDPLATIGSIYDHFGIEMTPHGRDAMADYKKANPRSARPAHEYDLGSEEQRAAEREAFKTYQDYFEVPSEL